MRKIVWILLIGLLLTGCRKAEPIQTEPPETVTAVTETVAVTQPETEEPTEISTEPPTEPPTAPPTEPPVDEDMVRIRDYIPEIREELAYATEENFTGQKIYNFYNAYLRSGTVQKLAAACEELKAQGLGILVWDGFRPVSAQAALWEICPDPRYVSHPVTGTRAHCRGNAVDLTLVNLETGEKLTMPTGFDDFSAMADRDYTDCTPEAAANAKLLEDVMIRNGFKPYSAEWWHFTDTDSYPVEENFEPPVG